MAGAFSFAREGSMKFVIAIATVIIGLSLACLPDSAEGWEHPHLIEPLPHDAADIPPVEMTGRAAVTVWLDCHPPSCDGLELQKSEMFTGYEYIPAPAALNAEGQCFNWSWTEPNPCALRAFIYIEAPVYLYTDMEITMVRSGGVSYLWLNDEMHIDEYFALHR